MTSIDRFNELGALLIRGIFRLKFAEFTASAAEPTADATQNLTEPDPLSDESDTCDLDVTNIG